MLSCLFVEAVELQSAEGPSRFSFTMDASIQRPFGWWFGARWFGGGGGSTRTRGSNPKSPIKGYLIHGWALRICREMFDILMNKWANGHLYDLKLGSLTTAHVTLFYMCLIKPLLNSGCTLLSVS